MKWGLILSVTIGITASVIVVRALFGLPVLMFAVVAACVAFGGSTALTLVLGPPRRPYKASAHRENLEHSGR